MTGYYDDGAGDEPQCQLCGAPWGFPYCSDACAAADDNGYYLYRWPDPADNEGKGSR
ncbi:hypothetical protein [Longispora albida]|uniref:hypothetical protein n=1 Tax=Longispora albida TaxID=203523 RepID=UPI000364ABB6|nr:hypothetical protein [Longispora albida]